MFRGKKDLPKGHPYVAEVSVSKHVLRCLAQQELVVVPPGLGDRWVDTYFTLVEK